MIVAIICIILIIFIFAFSYYAYKVAFYHKKGDFAALKETEVYKNNKQLMDNLYDELASIPCEIIQIKSFDNLKLSARYYHIDDNVPLQIQFHGYKGSALRDFCGGNKLAREMKNNTLIVDHRSHGESDGNVITFGIKERYDCLSWVNYACKRFGNEKIITLAGVSMGAATVLMASNLELPNNVKAIIADCPYSSPKDIIMKVSKEMKFPPKLVYPFIYLGALIFGKFKLNESSAVESVKNSKVPILLIHGDDDELCPCEMSKKIYNACTNEKMIKIFKGAPHGLSYIVDSKEYAKTVQEFIDKYVFLKEVN